MINPYEPPRQECEQSLSDILFKGLDSGWAFFWLAFFNWTVLNLTFRLLKFIGQWCDAQGC